MEGEGGGQRFRQPLPILGPGEKGGILVVIEIDQLDEHFRGDRVAAQDGGEPDLAPPDDALPNRLIGLDRKVVFPERLEQNV